MSENDLMPTPDRYFLSREECNKNQQLDSIVKLTKTENAREGRDTQVYNKDTYARLVAGCIVLNQDHTKVLMISSSKHRGKWIFPKGGVEYDEVDDFRKTAVRETWEEAGAVGKVIGKLPIVEDHRFMKEKAVKKTFEDIDLMVDGVKIPRSEFHFYELQLDELCEVWPESESRGRKWCTYEEAKHELHKAGRPELIEALNDSRISKDCSQIKFDEHSNVLLDAHPEDDDY